MPETGEQLYVNATIKNSNKDHDNEWLIFHIYRSVNREGHTGAKQQFVKSKVKVWLTGYITRHFMPEEDGCKMGRK